MPLPRWPPSHRLAELAAVPRAVSGPLNKIALLCLVFLVLGSTASCGQKADDTEALLDAMEITDGDWIADVGSGDGDYTIPMAERVGASGRVFAVDVDSDKVEDHDLGLKYVRAELKTAGFTIKKEVNPLMETSWGFYWMIVAQPASP